MKIAITTSDGNYVDTHFGKASTFFVYEVVDGALRTIEKRGVIPYCRQEGIKSTSDHTFVAEKFAIAYDLIKDCQVLITQQIGEVPKIRLKNLGIEVKLCYCAVEQVISTKNHQCEKIEL
ncbi:MAG: hypothetical protein IPM71_15015 [Bacteroidota bacterium]|nr:MAG: hypothetical protein IPM71_15015 [Bacteroidota bacterium]